MKRTLELLVNGSIAVLCLTVTGLLVKNHVVSATPPVPPTAIAEGTVLDLPEAIDGGSEVVLVAALAPGCGYCDESMPFYRALSDERRSQQADFRFVAAVRDDDQVDSERIALRVAGAELDQIVVGDFRRLGIPGTPMLIATDRTGTVLDVWLGKLDDEQERQVYAAVGLAPPS